MINSKVADVYITRRLPTKFLKLFHDNTITFDMWDSDEPISHQELLKNVPGRKGILCMLSDNIDKNLMKTAGSQLKTIATMSVGFNHIDLQYLKASKIRLGYTPKVLSEATAELALSLLLATSRRIIEANKTVPNGEWKAWAPFWMCGKGLMNASVGIVGLGQIGKKIAQRIASFRPSKIYYSGSGKSTSTVHLINMDSKDYVAEFKPLDELLSASDFVILSCLLNDSTRNLINDEKLAKMKPGSILINVSRGEVIDQDALYRVLSNSKGNGIAAAGLDVTTPEPLPVTSPLLSLNNCVIIPHLGSATLDTRNEMVRLSVENLIAGILDKPMPEEVQF